MGILTDWREYLQSWMVTRGEQQKRAYTEWMIARSGIDQAAPPAGRAEGLKWHVSGLFVYVLRRQGVWLRKLQALSAKTGILPILESPCRRGDASRRSPPELSSQWRSVIQLMSNVSTLGSCQGYAPSTMRISVLRAWYISFQLIFPKPWVNVVTNFKDKENVFKRSKDIFM